MTRDVYPDSLPQYAGVLDLSGTATRLARNSRRVLTSRRHLVQPTTAPTVVLSAADAATAISGSTLRTPLGAGVSGGAIDMVNDRNFAHSGTPSLLCKTGVNAAHVTTPNLTGTTSFQTYAPSARFNFYGDKLEFVFKAFSGHYEYRLRVNDEWVTYEAQYLSGLTIGSVYRVLVTFASVDERVIQFDWNGTSWSGVACAPAHTVSRAQLPADVPTVVMGDSLTAGANAGSAAGTVRLDTWIAYAAALLGWSDVRNAAIAGTGFVTVGGEAAFTSRLADLAVPGARFVFYGGLNDVAQVASTLPAAIDTMFSYVLTQAPSEFIVLGCHPKNGDAYASSGYQNVNNLLAAKAAAYGATFIDPFVIKPVTGNGNFTTPNGSGNADLFVNADAIHLTRAGHRHAGRVYADAIAESYTKSVA